MKALKQSAVGICLVLMLLSTQGSAQLYKWVDANGKVHYGDSPPEDARLQNINGELSSFTNVSVEAFTGSTAFTSDRKVVMFSTEWCGYCRKARRHFRKHNIAFVERDIEKSEKAARAFKELNGKGVPVILIGEKRMNGFSVSTFDRLYKSGS